MSIGHRTRPPSARLIADVHVDDPDVSRALANGGAAVREVQRDPALPREMHPGDLFYVDSTGRLVALPAGAAGTVLTMTAEGFPAWV